MKVSRHYVFFQVSQFFSTARRRTLSGGSLSGGRYIMIEGTARRRTPDSIRHLLEEQFTRFHFLDSSLVLVHV